MSSRFDAVLISIDDTLDFRVFRRGASSGALGFWAFPEREATEDLAVSSRLALSSRWILSAALWSFSERKS